MYRSTVLAVLLLGWCKASSGQAAQADSQTLRAILTELQQLRQELHASNMAFQKAQILLRHWQVQREAVSLATQRSNEAHSKLTEVQARQNHLAAEIKRLEAAVEQPENELEKKQVEDLITQLKSELESVGKEEQTLQIRASDSEEQLRIEQAKLSGLEDQLERLEKQQGN
jgi:chromosome segregation ATPase